MKNKNIYLPLKCFVGCLFCHGFAEIFLSSKYEARAIAYSGYFVSLYMLTYYVPVFLVSLALIRRNLAIGKGVAIIPLFASVTYLCYFMPMDVLLVGAGNLTAKLLVVLNVISILWVAHVLRKAMLFLFFYKKMAVGFCLQSDGMVLLRNEKGPTYKITSKAWEQGVALFSGVLATICLVNNWHSDVTLYRSILTSIVLVFIFPFYFFTLDFFAFLFAKTLFFPMFIYVKQRKLVVIEKS